MKPRTRKEWLAAVEHSKRAFSGKPYEYLNLPDYIPSTFRVRYLCPDHGKKEAYAFSHLKHGCNDCGKMRIGASKKGKPGWRKLSLDQALQKAKALYPDLDYSRVTEYDPQASWSVRCRKHTLTFEVKVLWHLWHKVRGCPSCLEEKARRRGESRQKVGEEAFRESLARFGYEYVKYTKAHAPAYASCPQHGEFCIPKGYYLTQGQSICPQCRKSSSTAEYVLRTALEASGLKVTASRRDLITPQEIDLYLPKYKVGIEVNGIYWHEGAERNYHVSKSEEAAKKGIQLLHFTDVETLQKTELLVSMIRAKCGLFKHRIGARSTKVSPLSVERARSFYTAHHLQGFVGALVHLGLKLGKRLVCAASFGKPRFSRDGDWELLRFATRREYQVYGGMQKLITAFAREHQGTLLSFANRRYSSGGVYEALGFTLVRVSKPSYSWHNAQGEELSRYQSQKHRLEDLLDDFDPDLSETENMRQNKFYQLWDCGTLVYKRELPK